MRSIRNAATVERELPWVGRTTRSWRRSGLWRTARPHRRAMSRIFSVHGESGWLNTRLDQEQVRAAVQPAQLCSEDRGEAGGAQARQGVAPIHDAGVGDRPQRCSVAHPGGQLVRQLGHLLGLGGEDERAGHAARARARGRPA